jgi:23S rRNA (uracil1939-C5)-methyltransferase
MQGTVAPALAFGGEGIIRSQGLVLFVPFAAPGDLLEVAMTQKKRSYGRAKIVQIINPSPLRTTPLCPLFGTCGGCQLQHLQQAAQLEAKRLFVQDALQRIGGLSVSVPTVISANTNWAYRRHIKLTVRKKGAGLEAGYISLDNKTLLMLTHCPIFNTAEDPIVEQVQHLLEHIPHKELENGEVRLLKSSCNRYHVTLHLPICLPKEIETLFADAFHKNNWKSLCVKTLEKQLLLGQMQDCFPILGLHITASPFTFLQNHPEQSEKLYRAAIHCFSAKKILDLYCGVGVTSLLLAKAGKKVIGIELNPEAIAFARENALLNQLSNVEFIAAPAEEEAERQIKKFQPQGILLNPPRTGVDPKLIQVLLSYKPQEIVYISCMPSTLARDLKRLCANGYTITSIQPFDMFPQTTHVETIVHLILSR